MTELDVRIITVEWLDEEAREAEVTFQAGKGTYVAFCHPCNFDGEGPQRVRLDCLLADMPTDTMLTGNASRERKLKKREDGRWAYDLYGRIQRLNPLEIDCGDTQIELPRLFRDVRLIGEYIYAHVARLDISRTDARCDQV